MHEQQITVEFDTNFTQTSVMAKMVVKMQAQLGRLEARVRELERARMPVMLHRPSAPLH